MVNFKLSIGDKLKMKAISIFTGVPMEFLSGLWKFMDGKKTIFGLLITAVSAVATAVPAILAVFGVDAVHVAAVVGVATTVVGILHKIYKFLYKEEPPAGE